ncbi:MAG TPA: Fe-S protein assembly co-chaperone HscB [Burkholderiales bacterium]|nr:Fe-S protein assembly co-chaperone HscB [Burkholderiales bacterium]
MSTSFTQNHFEMFGLPARFAVDDAALDQAFREVQAQVHPDRHAAAGDAGRRVAMQWSTRANEAYQTLKNPLKRATYLLHLRGRDIGAENNTAMEPAFLMQQMEWREAVEDATAAKNPDALDVLLRDMREDKKSRYGKLGALLDSGADAPAVEAVRQLMFVDKLEDEIRLSLEELDA